jgi:hypothetical protein
MAVCNSLQQAEPGRQMGIRRTVSDLKAGWLFVFTDKIKNKLEFKKNGNIRSLDKKELLPQ